jgi:hypothetical protein
MSLTVSKMNRICVGLCISVIAVLSAAAQPAVGVDFFDAISNRLAATSEQTATPKRSKDAFNKVCPFDNSPAAKKVLSEYGAMFVASGEIASPPTCLFRSDDEVTAFQSRLAMGKVVVNGVQFQFQKAAAESLNAAVSDALIQGMRIRPLDGAIAGGRRYSDTVRLWNSRFHPALKYWVAHERISPDDAATASAMTVDQQIEKVIEWEASGMPFGTNLKGSIFASTAPPGSSQHLSLIAIDIAPPLTPSVIAVMNSHGWYQTVKGDRSHFTYLGLTEKELPGRGLKAILFDGIMYWVPNIFPEPAANP